MTLGRLKVVFLSAAFATGLAACEGESEVGGQDGGASASGDASSADTRVIDARIVDGATDTRDGASDAHDSASDAHDSASDSAPAEAGVTDAAADRGEASLPDAGGDAPTIDAATDVEPTDAPGAETSTDAAPIDGTGTVLADVAIADAELDGAVDAAEIDAATDVATADAESADLPPPVFADAAADQSVVVAEDAATDDAAGDAATDDAATDDAATDDAATDDAALGDDASSEIDAGAAATDASLAEPFVGELTPATGERNHAVALTISGKGFAEEAAVFLADKKLPTTRTSAQELTVEVPAAELSIAGEYAVIVKNIRAGETKESNILYFKVAAGAGEPEIVYFSPDNGLPEDVILVVGRNILPGSDLEPKPLLVDPNGKSIEFSKAGELADYHDEKYQTLEFEIPEGWTTGPLTLTTLNGKYRGRIYRVAENLTSWRNTKAVVSSQDDRYPGQQGIDNSLLTSWFTDTGDCSGCGEGTWLQVDLGSDETIGRIALRGDREFGEYDFTRATIAIYDNPAFPPLWWRTYDLPAPDRDLDIVLTPPIEGAKYVRVTGEEAEDWGPGFAELEIFEK